MLDVFIFDKINGLANVSKILDWFGIFLADYFPYILGAILVLLFIWKKNRLMVISVGISVFLSRIVIAEILKLVIHRARPNMADFRSFPSGHAAIFFAVAMAVYFYNKKLGIWFFIAAIIIGVARIFVGVHWPSDVLAGAMIGIISGIIVNKIIHKQPKQIFSDTQSQ